MKKNLNFHWNLHFMPIAYGSRHLPIKPLQIIRSSAERFGIFFLDFFQPFFELFFQMCFFTFLIFNAHNWMYKTDDNIKTKTLLVHIYIKTSRLKSKAVTDSHSEIEWIFGNDRYLPTKINQIELYTHSRRRVFCHF